MIFRISSSASVINKVTKLSLRVSQPQQTLATSSLITNTTRRCQFSTNNTNTLINSIRNYTTTSSSSSNKSLNNNNKMSEAVASFSRSGLEDLLKRRFFYIQSFQIYRGVAGLYDYGPPGCAVKSNLINFWRQHFVLSEDMLEVDCSALTPEVVLEASGHVAKFSDFMVKDEITKAYYRADHLLEAHVEKMLEDPKLTAEKIAELKHVLTKAGDYPIEELKAALTKYNVKAPETNNAISEPYPFNLMFKTQIGPSGASVGYLRPETAQGIFVNFRRLLDFNGGKLPFAAAQIGNAYRNEIAPRSGLLRVREFTMAEIEHFVNPEDKSHPNFAEIANVKTNLLSAASQDGAKEIEVTTFGDAVAKGLINNQTLAYFMARTQQFLHTVGIKPARLRFRQHQSNEMAHYASDCWDAEIHTSYGWVECVGHADRSCYDLTVHSKVSGTSLTVFEEFKEGPKMVDCIDVNMNKGVMGKTFKKEAKAPMDYLAALADNVEEALAIQKELNEKGSYTLTIDGVAFTLTKDMVTLTKTQKKVAGITYSPHVIEPSFGLGRIIYAILEHAYWVRGGDEQRGVLSLAPIIAPVKCSVLPLTTSEKLAPFVGKIIKLLKEAGISNKVDDTGNAIGRKYARTDEIGIPFGITIDFTTPEDQTVTLRERDTTKQIRIPIADLADILKKLCDNTITWESVSTTYPAYESNSE